MTRAAATQGMADDSDAHSQYQRAVADTGTTRIVACVDAVAVSEHETFLVREHLFVPGVKDGDVEAALADYFAGLSARFAADPERDPFEDWTLTVVLRRN